MTLEEILNTDVYTALPEGFRVEEELNCQNEDRLPNISTLLRASEVDLGIINDQPPTTSAIPATSFTRSEEDSADDIPISEYLRRFQHDIPQQDFNDPLTEFHQSEIHVTEFHQSEIHVTEDVEPQLPPKKRPIPQEQAIPQQPPQKKSRIVIAPINPVYLATVQASTSADVQPSTSVNVQPSTSADVQPSTSAAADVQPSTSAAADVQPSTSAAVADVQPSTSANAPGTVVILDFGNTKLPKHIYTEFYDIFQVEQPSREIDGAINFERSQKRWTNYVNRKKGVRNRTPREIDNARQQGYVLDPDGVTQFTIKAYHGVKRGERGGVYQVAVEFTDKTIRWVDKKEIKKHSSASLQLYFDKLNQPNPEINPDGLQLS